MNPFCAARPRGPHGRDVGLTRVNGCNDRQEAAPLAGSSRCGVTPRRSTTKTPCRFESVNLAAQLPAKPTSPSSTVPHFGGRPASGSTREPRPKMLSKRAFHESAAEERKCREVSRAGGGKLRARVLPFPLEFQGCPRGVEHHLLGVGQPHFEGGQAHEVF